MCHSCTSHILLKQADRHIHGLVCKTCMCCGIIAKVWKVHVFPSAEIEMLHVAYTMPSDNICIEAPSGPALPLPVCIMHTCCCDVVKVWRAKVTLLARYAAACCFHHVFNGIFVQQHLQGLHHHCLVCHHWLHQNLSLQVSLSARQLTLRLRLSLSLSQNQTMSPSCCPIVPSCKLDT